MVWLSSATSTRTGGSAGTGAARVEARRHRLGRRLGGGGRDPEPEGAAEPRHAVHGDLAAHQLHQLARDGEPEPGAAALPGDRGVDLGEALEEPALGLLRDADAGVAHRHLEPPAPRLVVEARHHAAGLGELHRVADEVHQHLPEPGGVADHRRRHPGRGRRDHLDVAVAGARRHQRRHVAGQPADVHRRRVEGDPVGLELREVEDVVEDVEELARRVRRRSPPARAAPGRARS